MSAESDGNARPARTLSEAEKRALVLLLEAGIPDEQVPLYMEFVHVTWAAVHGDDPPEDGPGILERLPVPGS